MKKSFATGMKMAGILIAAIVVGYLLLVCVYAIPTENMNQHLEAASLVFYQEGTYPQIMKGYSDSQLDNWTDSAMLLMAVHENESPAYLSALTNEYSTIPEQDPTQTLVSIYVDKATDNLVDYGYGRYWHGYLIWLKPLLYFMDYSSIKYLNLFIQFLFFTWIILLLGCRKRMVFAFPILITWLFINPLSTILSMQFSTVIILMFIQILLFLLLEQRYLNDRFLLMVHFLIVGSCTAYFDLLTYPLVALGIPLLFWFSLHGGYTLVENGLFIVKHSFLWGAGYGGMWIGKWLLGSFITKQDIVADALKQVVFRTSYTGADAVDFSYGQMINFLFEASNGIIIFLSAVLFIGFLFYRAKKHELSLNMSAALPCIVVGCFPFLWYAVLGNHSYWHAWFTYRELAVSIFAVWMIGVCGKDRI